MNPSPSIEAQCFSTLFLVEVERDSQCQKVIQCRIADQLASPGPIAPDIQEFVPSADLANLCEGYILGFPCQDLCMQCRHDDNLSFDVCVCCCNDVIRVLTGVQIDR